MEWIILLFISAFFAHKWSKNRVSSKAPLNQIKPDISSIELSQEQIDLFGTLNSSNEHFLITGKAGTGKSLLLQYLKKHSSKKLVVVAPTGVAALNIGGQTIHSFFRIPPSFNSSGTLIIDSKRALLLKHIDTVVIDEISMVRADLMDDIDKILRHARSSDLPFGGVQIIMFGDLYQLPPVVEDPQLYQYFHSKLGGIYFFNAHVWRKAGFRVHQLNTVFRQKDKKFKDLLNSIRSGKVNSALLNKLNSRVTGDIPSTNIITLTTTNQSANQVNKERLDSLDGKLYEYRAIIEGEIDRLYFPTEDVLRLKKGAQVMLLKNDPLKRWVNGSVGYIHSLSKGEIKVKLDSKVYSVPQETWKRIQYRYREKEDIIDEETISSFTQFPLRLAWSITIHKSQGQTYGSVIVDIGTGAFAHGQTYVALSRCISLDGIYLKREISREDIIIDPLITNFMKHSLVNVNKGLT